jgi:hypothetical protein
MLNKKQQNRDYILNVIFSFYFATQIIALVLLAGKTKLCVEPKDEKERMKKSGRLEYKHIINSLRGVTRENLEIATIKES